MCTGMLIVLALGVVNPTLTTYMLTPLKGQNQEWSIFLTGKANNIYEN